MSTRASSSPRGSALPLAVLEHLAAPLLHALPATCDAGSVEVEVLEDAITQEGADLVRVTKLRLVPAAAPKPAATGIAALIGATRWEEIRVTVVDGHTLRISCGRASVRRTYRDLGLHAENSREPTRKWDLLLAICAGHGTFQWKELGEFHAVSQAISVLRRKLKEAFGLEDDPFHPFANGWRVKFFATSES